MNTRLFLKSQKQTLLKEAPLTDGAVQTEGLHVEECKYFSQYSTEDGSKPSTKAFGGFP